jgi:predicted nucleic acid-binding protein
MLGPPVCVDASVVVKLVLPERGRTSALAVWERWLGEEREIVAPYLLSYEVTSAIWRKAKRGLLEPRDARASVGAALNLGVRLVHPEGLCLRAFDLAARFDLATAYDAQYLALSEMLGAEFWTADERLYNAIRADVATVRLLRESQQR